jgi:chemotaxis response regulator CheB
MAPTRHTTGQPIRRVLLVSSPTLFGESLELLLRNAGDIEVVGSVALRDDVCEAVARAAPDVVVLADEHPESTGVLNLTAVLMERFPDLRVIKTGPAEATLRVLAAQSWPASSLDLISAIREGHPRRT